MTADERWLPVAGWEGYYSVSNQGRVRSEPRRVVHGYAGLVTISGRTLKLKLARRPDGTTSYYTVCLRRQGVREYPVVHKLVAIAFIGPRPEGQQCCHNNGNPLDNRAENLRWDTSRANILDSVRHGTHSKTRRRECSFGHLLIAPNLNPTQLRRGRRSCYACDRAITTIRNRSRSDNSKPVPDKKQEADRRYAEIMHSEDQELAQLGSVPPARTT